jgi:hypothetical protein
MTNEEIREQIQENIIAYFDHPSRSRHVNPTGNVSVDDLCQIVVDCFAEDKKKNDSSRYQNHPEEVYARDWMDGKKC